MSTKEESDFILINNNCVHDERLSAGALGVLIYLTGKNFNAKDASAAVRQRFNFGKDRFYSITSELCALGYMERLKERTKNGSFKDSSLKVSDRPIFTKQDNN